jgi:nucleoside-diphosphate-sugar epimerase
MTEEELDDALSVPRQETTAALDACSGDVVILGAGGKMGPTLARMARRGARDSRRVIAVSRWSSADARKRLESVDVETVSCDLMDREAVAKLPDAPNVIFMAGQKFGTTGSPELTWGMNTLVPAFCADRYRDARIVAFSTGNVYALTPVESGGSRETDALAPIGEYAASCVGRERMFELHSRRYGTPVSILRLNYAIDLRYGVLVDIALKVFRSEPVSVDMGYVNVIWQGDANRVAIEALPLAASPPFVVNLTGRETLSVREQAGWFGQRFGKAPRFTGSERADALLSNTTRMASSFAPPSVSVDDLRRRVADWVQNGGPLLGKPTKFETRDGKF